MKITKEQFRALLRGEPDLQLVDHLAAQFEVTDEDTLSSLNHSIGLTSASVFALDSHRLSISHIHIDGKFVRDLCEIGRFEAVRPAKTSELMAKLKAAEPKPVPTGSAEEQNREFHKKYGELYNADPNCVHELDSSCVSGIRCRHCGGWFCL